MNHLAHAWLAAPDPDAIVGGVLGDFWRGAPDPAWSVGLRAGVLLHRRIDRWTDSHPAVTAARGLFAAPYRRYAGVLLDLWFDHRLAATWARWSDEQLEQFAGRTDAALAAAPAGLPDGFYRYARRMADYRGWQAYAEPAHLDAVLRGMAARARFANPLVGARRVLEDNAAALESVFVELLPELRRAVGAETRTPPVGGVFGKPFFATPISGSRSST